MSDQRDQDDIAEPTEAADPIDRIDPFDPIDSRDFSDHSDHREVLVEDLSTGWTKPQDSAFGLDLVAPGSMFECISQLCDEGAPSRETVVRGVDEPGHFAAASNGLASKDLEVDNVVGD